MSMTDNSDKGDMIAELCYLSLDESVDGRTFYHLLQAIMEMFKSL